jgi:PKD repeat protein
MGMWYRRGPLVWVICMVLFAGGCTILESGLVARFEVSPLLVYTGEPTTFDGLPSYSDVTIVSYAWAFGDGETALGQQVIHNYAESGSYPVTLEIIDSMGKTAHVTREIIVYVRSGTEIFAEDFSSGKVSLDNWSLDSAWASIDESAVENIGPSHGFVLHISSGMDRWHRLTIPIEIPPLRVGQQVRFTYDVMTAHTQDAHTFTISPARKSLETIAQSLPFFVYTSEEGGATMREPDLEGGEICHLVPFKPGVFLWYSVEFAFKSGKYDFSINDELYASGTIPETFHEKTTWLMLLGDESHTEACDAYFDNIHVVITE